MARVAVVINKHNGELRFSETFVRVHIERLPCTTVTVMGVPNRRMIVQNGRSLLFPSRRAVPLGTRWLARRLRLSSVAEQDRGAMRDFLERWNIDAVLAEYGPNAVSVMESCNDLHVPLIAHFHGFDAYHHWYIETFHAQYRRLFELASATVAVSSHMRDRLIGLGADPQRVVVNPCGADLPFEGYANPQHVPPRFIMVGRLTEKKSPLTSLRAFSMLGVDGATLDVVGDGELMSACHELARALGISRRVTFHGALPHPQVLELMLQSRCFIQHSVTADNGDREGTPVSVLEAMGLGLPVVGTLHGGIPDIVARPDLGALVAEHDVEAMAAEMRRFALNSAVAADIGRNARREVLANWTAEKRVRVLWEVIERAIDQQRTQVPGQDASDAPGRCEPRQPAAHP